MKANAMKGKKLTSFHGTRKNNRNMNSSMDKRRLGMPALTQVRTHFQLKFSSLQRY
jgi:hypothetical protein